ncbi:MAG: alpha-galactosidase [Oscillospiraceae bacterium]|nr:alpha-galactosidase [Oscillospiraceae bacterium]
MQNYARNTGVPFETYNTAATAQECARAAAYYRKLVEQPADFPCSFRLDGTQYQGFGADFTRVSAEAETAENKRTDTLVFRHTSGLQVTAICAHYPDFAAFEWTLWFEAGGADSPRIHALNGADVHFGGKAPRLCGILGDARNEDFGTEAEMLQGNLGYVGATYGMNNQPYDNPLALGIPYEMKPRGGCASNHEFPYFKLQFENDGVFTAVGWPGQWRAGFLAGREGVRLSIGQEFLDTILHPGEKLRTPLNCFVLYDGCDADRQANLWRRFMMECNMPRRNGQLMQPATASLPVGTALMATATEENQLARIKAYRDKGIHWDYWWMDAGWYTIGTNGECPQELDDYGFSGTWELREKDFPTRMKAISDCMAETGGETILWFEPERCGLEPDTLRDDGTTLKKEWLLNYRWEVSVPRKDGSMMTVPMQMVNLGDPDCYTWLRDRIFKVLREGNIGLYREDHNIRPLEYWKRTDEPGRIGLTENKYIINHLRLWDDIRAEFDGMFIDSCASGGRRNDLESMRRALPLHLSDFFNWRFSCRQAVQQSMFAWFPYFKSWTKFMEEKLDDTLEYQMRTSMAPFTSVRVDCLDMTDETAASIRTYLDEWRAVCNYYYADYYPLLDWNYDEGRWMAHMFVDPVRQEGFVQAYRRELNDEPLRYIPLKGLEPEALYEFTAVTAEGANVRLTGAQAMTEGLPVSLSQPASAATVKFTAVG